MRSQYKWIEEFQVIDHGIEHNQYFRGCGTSHTIYSECVTGCGENATEAIEDALEQIAMHLGSIDMDAITEREEYKDCQTRRVKDFTVERFHRRNGNLKRGQDYGDIENEHYYYVSIRYNVCELTERELKSAGLAA